MLNFASDYTEGAHPEILKRLVETNMEQLPGYGSDSYSLSAIEKIRKAVGKPDCQVILLAGGTQANQFVIGNMLKPFEGVIAAESGHINVHEAGAIEATGHKVLALPQHDGKIDFNELQEYLNLFYEDDNHEHMIYPGMVYISHPTEYGTLYTKKELADLHRICRKYEMPLFMDGARLGYGLTSSESDMDLKDIAENTDVFYIGGTKVGTLIGEAVVFCDYIPDHLVTRVKRNGALLAKGRLVGIQFDCLFTDDLYFRIAAHGNQMAQLLKDGLRENGYRFYLDSPTNQQFVILEDEQYEKLKQQVNMSFWNRYDRNHVVVRLATSWATEKAAVEQLLEIMKQH